MKTHTDKKVAPQPRASATQPGSTGDAQLPAPVPGPRTGDAGGATAAEVLHVSLAVMQHVGAEAAIVLAAIEAGYLDARAIANATGIRREDVRIRWARLARAKYPLPEPTPVSD